MPSHRADTPADAPTTVRTGPTATAPQQRRRDLRTAEQNGGSDVAFPSRRQVHTFARSGQEAGRGGTALLERETPADHTVTWGAVALDPLFVTRHGQQLADGWVVAEPVRGKRPRQPSPRRMVPPQARPGSAHPDAGDAPFDAVTAEEPAAPPPPVPLLDRVWRAPDIARPAPTRAGRVRLVRREAAAVTPSAVGRRPALGLPQVGIVGALGLATIAVPLTGAFAVAPPAKTDSGSVSAAAAALAPLPPFPLASLPPVTALGDARLLPDEEPAASVPARLAAPRVLLVGGSVSRSNERSVLPGCNGQIPYVTSVLNGQLPASMLCTLWDSRRQLRSDAAVAIAKLNIAYQQQFGHPMCFNDAYRSLTQQIRVKAERGGFAARPGTSEHGWGLAVDLCDGVDAGPGSPTYQWMRENAPFYGWNNPTWAQAGGAGPYEPWHWEYFPGVKDQSSGD